MTRVNLFRTSMITGTILLCALLFSCSVKILSDVNSDGRYVVYKLSISNRDFPPCSYLSKAVIKYDRERLWFARNVNTFWLKHGKPVITFSREGLIINFGLIPSTYFDDSGEMDLYFLPLKKGPASFSGELLIKEVEYYLSPRKKTISIKIRPLEMPVSHVYDARGLNNKGFTEILTGRGSFFNENFFYGCDTKIYIPPKTPVNKTLEQVNKVIIAKGFHDAGTVDFPGGKAFCYRRFYGKGNNLTELRAVYDDEKFDQSLYLYMCSSSRNDSEFDSIESELRKIININE